MRWDDGIQWTSKQAKLSDADLDTLVAELDAARPDGRVCVIALCPDGGGPWLCLEGGGRFTRQNILDQLDGLEDEGDDLLFKLGVATRESVEALPEFGGW